MARRQPTLAEVSLRQQVSAANRVAFRHWWEGGVPPATYWLMGLAVVVIAGGVAAWKFLA